MAALNQSLARTVAGGSEEEMEEDQLDDIPMADGSQNPEALEAAKAAAEELHRLKSLFKGKRYNNAELLTIMIATRFLDSIARFQPIPTDYRHNHCRL